MHFPPLFLNGITLLLTMSKRKLASTTTPPSSKHLNLYKKSYKGGGAKDRHLAVFEEVRRRVAAAGADGAAATTTTTTTARVLYPGCHRHLTAALVFPDVTFVDCDPKVGPLYADDDRAAREFVQANKLYGQDAQYRFHCYDVNQRMPKIRNDYDLLISLSAGAVAGPCRKYVAKGGYLLVNDSHSDARAAFVSGDWELLAYWDDANRTFTTDNLDRCFQVIEKQSSSSQAISAEQVRESVAIGSVSKRSFRLLMEPMFFLFQKK